VFQADLLPAKRTRSKLKVSGLVYRVDAARKAKNGVSRIIFICLTFDGMFLQYKKTQGKKQINSPIG
jgi:hypothetical protein